MDYNTPNPKMLYDAYYIYFNKASDALKNKNYVVAHRNLTSAYETLLKLAKISDGQLKEARLKKANEIYDFSLQIEDKIKSKAVSNASSPRDDLKMVSNSSNTSSSNSLDDDTTRFEPITCTDIKLGDVAGLKEAKYEIKQKVIEPFKHPEIYQKFNKSMGGGILLYGVPGTGKTMFAQAVAGDINAKFFTVRCSDIMSKWVGSSEKNIKSLFDEARKYPTSIIFFDEFESFGSKRGSNSTIQNRVVQEFLTQIQGFQKNENNLVIIAATNRPWDIDSAFMRPGRFDRRIYVPIPDEEAREVIVRNKLKNIPCDPNLNINKIVELTKGFNGSDVSNFCEKLKDLAIEREIEMGTTSAISDNDIEIASMTIHSSVDPEDLKKLADWQEKIEKNK